MKTYTFGDGKITGSSVAVVGCLHGDEKIGLEVIEELKKLHEDEREAYLRGFEPVIYLQNQRLELIVANEEALRENVRFIDSDANRIFPGNENGNHEEALVYNLANHLSGFDYVIDIHSTTAQTHDFAIVTSDRKKVLDFAGYAPVPYIVHMQPHIAQGKALIDHTKCGVSLEFDARTPTDKALSVVNVMVEYALRGKGLRAQQPVLTVSRTMNPETDMDRYEKPLRNFELAHDKFGTKFYPVLLGEKAYGGRCFMAKPM